MRLQCRRWKPPPASACWQAGDVCESPFHLRQLGERRPRFVGPRQKALDRAVDDARIDAGGPVVPDTEPVQSAGAVVFDHNIGPLDQSFEDPMTPWLAQVYSDASLVPIEREERRSLVRLIPRRVADPRIFDLANLRPQIAENETGARSSHDVT